ncbi:putative YigZ family protein [Desulfohalotomaculum tongense]|uniref:YigZ family protein n=1 Tax=Desulforadius tongensis TaxID=1216062 RepID=UPI00195B25B8|nr:YigZ family protein [Desulforadius tongensis]MBM7855664.1 putative YigZ family protein [Desulforadius tongensis]
MKNSYLTLQQPVQTEIIIKKSRFITSASPVDNEDEANAFIEQIRTEHSTATHNVFAYVINEQVQRFSDDGEPSGTAGRPVLEVINRKGLSKTALVVTRYFGGIMLGAGGLVRAYSEAAVKGIETAGIVEKLLHRQLNITMDYHWIGLVKREVENAGAKQLHIQYLQQVKMQFYLLPDAAKSLTQKLIEATAAQINIEEGPLSYI